MDNRQNQPKKTQHSNTQTLEIQNFTMSIKFWQTLVFLFLQSRQPIVLIVQKFIRQRWSNMRRGVLEGKKRVGPKVLEQNDSLKEAARWCCENTPLFSLITSRSLFSAREKVGSYSISQKLWYSHVSTLPRALRKKKWDWHDTFFFYSNGQDLSFSSYFCSRCHKDILTLMTNPPPPPKETAHGSHRACLIQRKSTWEVFFSLFLCSTLCNKTPHEIVCFGNILLFCTQEVCPGSLVCGVGA